MTTENPAPKPGINHAVDALIVAIEDVDSPPMFLTGLGQVVGAVEALQAEQQRTDITNVFRALARLATEVHGRAPEGESP